ncbi:MAG: NYN domain-containing protein [Chloroflexi bacterium]|nr:NYN domain-containing protein [Chloroflexota bacterium]MBU1661968.1 NYN domain-containing protein [Chloroflexota bacterium]
MKTNIYIDGFNLYYGCIKDTPYKWLDLSRMCRFLLPKDEIQCIKYFTARVTPRPNDPDKPLRQRIYLRALQTIPNLEIILGRFLSHKVMMPRFPIGSGYIKVVKTEEKGSDVNLATHLLLDGFRNDYELAVVVSNDSDLLLPIRMVIEEFGKPVGLLNPQKNLSVVLLPHVMFVKNIRKNILKNSQFPPILADNNGRFSKPNTW